MHVVKHKGTFLHLHCFHYFTFTTCVYSTDVSSHWGSLRCIGIHPTHLMPMRWISLLRIITSTVVAFACCSVAHTVVCYLQHGRCPAFSSAFRGFCIRREILRWLRTRVEEARRHVHSACARYRTRLNSCGRENHARIAALGFLTAWIVLRK